MHEWALAEAVVTTARKAAMEQRLEEIVTIKVRLGELQRLEHEIFAEALQQLLQQEAALLKNARVSIKIEQTRFRCRLCAREWGLDESDASPEECEAIHFIPEMAHVYLHCLSCSSPDFEIVKGRGLWLDALEGS